jgi:hypothetical protein
VKNPFRPSAGSTPPEVIGRAGLLDAFVRGLNQAAGVHGGLTIITGARGIGKTVMLGVAQELARGHGWDVLSETATRDLAARLMESMRRLDEARFGARTPGVWPDIGSALLRRLQESGGGLVITVDEIHAVDRDDLARIGAAVRAFTREGLPVALVMAGLPAEVSELLAEEPAAFLRQADRIVLHNVAVDDVEESFARTFAAGGFDAPSGTFRQAAEATGGYPYLVQLVGYFLRREAEAGQGLTPSMVDRAIEQAHQRNARSASTR